MVVCARRASVGWALHPCCGARAGHEGLSLISATMSLGPSGAFPACLVLTSVEPHHLQGSCWRRSGFQYFSPLSLIHFKVFTPLNFL